MRMGMDEVYNVYFNIVKAVVARGVEVFTNFWPWSVVSNVVEVTLETVH